MATSNDLERAVLSVVGNGRMAQPMFLPDEDVALPHAYLMPGNAEIIRANDGTWIWMVAYDVILCTRSRDRRRERAMAQALDAAGIGYEISFSYDMEQRVFMTIYTTDPVEESED